MTDEEFGAACDEIARLADLIAGGTPEQIYANADGGWWRAFDTLREVYNEWLAS